VLESNAAKQICKCQTKCEVSEVSNKPAVLEMRLWLSDRIASQPFGSAWGRICGSCRGKARSEEGVRRIGADAASIESHGSEPLPCYL